MPNISPENFDYQIVDPTRLRESEHEALNALYRETVELDFPGRTPAEYDYWVSHVNRQRHDVNSEVGGPIQTVNQKYARPINAVILDKKTAEPVGVITNLDNASSTREIKKPIKVLQPLVRKMEIESKLRSERLINKRWATFGARAFKQELFVGSSDLELASPMDAAAWFALRHRDPRQPVSSFPYTGERLWAQMLFSWGVEDRNEGGQDIEVFGPNTGPVKQSRHTTPEGYNGVASVRSIILNKPGMRQFFQYIIEED